MSVSTHSRTDSSASSRDHYQALHNGLDRLHIGEPRVGTQLDDDSDEDILTPIKPSAKALGKRKVVDAEQPEREFSVSLYVSRIVV